ncbi:Predicted amino acid dehydrogenase [Marinobacter daqiaonensis]|uniref:Predicted amino acid dehydrogenase n=1 Tax=Marinobacter daqiaonensis TaxID=650891 RepID=A0A1I6HIX3_9GAMM|nr:PilZ domain-containing protein [Marinobacter daqiaonensis]SFR54237.1 Predicted amino acid dehydrogenase [Marinobacter daqiaonensis]
MIRMHGEYRRHLRSGIRVPVVLNYANHTIETNTLNVSASGLRLKRPDGVYIRPGEVIDVDFPDRADLDVAAKVTHTGRSHIGVQFHRRRFSETELNTLYRAAPAWQRLTARSKRALWKNSRRIAVFSANTYLRPLIHAAARPHFLFAVYGNQQQAGSYFTPRMAKRMPSNLVLGFIRNQDMRGLLVASQFLEHELEEDSEKVRLYLDQLQRDYPNVRRIALVGRLPNFAMKAGVEMTGPLVEGSLGTRYMIWDVARQMGERPQYCQQTSIVVLGGAGRIGNAVCRDLTGLYDRVIGFDPRYEADRELTTEQGTVLQTSSLSHLKDEKLYIGLTHQGDAVLELRDHITPGALIADDTHPCISLAAREKLQERQIAVEKVVLSHEEFLMWPRMPDWSNRDIPGCLVEALVLLRQPGVGEGNFSEFCQEAEFLGFTGRLIRPLDE